MKTEAFLVREKGFLSKNVSKYFFIKICADG